MSQTVRSFTTVSAPVSKGFAAAAVSWLRQARLDAAMRRAFASMDERTLRDLGLSRAQATFMTETGVLVPGNLR